MLVTDGFDENSTVKLDAVVAAAQAARTTVYGLAIGGINGVSLTGQSTLGHLTTRTGGRVFFPWRDSELPQIAKRVAEDARNRYLITTRRRTRKRTARGARSPSRCPGAQGRGARGISGAHAAANRATIEFHVTNSEGGYVTLASTDFEVVEDGVRSVVDTFHEALDPVSIMLTLDASGSMVKAAGTVRETAREFVRAVRKEDRLSVVTFADEVQVEHALSGDRALSMTAIDKYVASGGTALYDGLWDSLVQLKKESGRRAIVLLTDGRDENNPERLRKCSHLRRSAHTDTRGRGDDFRGRPRGAH